MSVTLAPRALMEEKAAWPGVSRKVIFSPEGSWTAGEAITVEGATLIFFFMETFTVSVERRLRLPAPPVAD